MDLQSKVILITGASSGIGRALAKNLAVNGAKVALVARRQALLEELAAEIAAVQGEAVVLPADVTKREQALRAVATAAERFGRLDAVVNAAGIGYFGTVARMDPADFDFMIQTNVSGLLHVTQAAIPYLKESHGVIVNISSGLSKRALPYLSAYAGTKSMVNALSEGMRLELKPYGVKVLNYSPPEVETGFAERSRKEPGMEEFAYGRKGVSAAQIADDIARAIRRGKREVVRGKSLMVLNALFPKLVDSIFYRTMVLKMDKKEQD